MVRDRERCPGAVGATVGDWMDGGCSTGNDRSSRGGAGCKGDGRGGCSAGDDKGWQRGVAGACMSDSR